MPARSGPVIGPGSRNSTSSRARPGASARLRPGHAFPGGDVVADFAAKLGVALPGARPVRANDGLSREAMAVAWCRLAGCLGPDYPDRARAARFRATPARALSGFGQGRFAFAEAVLAPAVAAQRADLDWMEVPAGPEAARSRPARRRDRGCRRHGGDRRGLRDRAGRPSRYPAAAALAAAPGADAPRAGHAAGPWPAGAGMTDRRGQSPARHGYGLDR